MAIKQIDEKCGTTHNMTKLSVSSAVASITMTTISVPLNVFIIICVIRGRKTKFKNLFYKLLLNIAIADLLTGIVATPPSVNFFIKEALRKEVTYLDTVATHLSVFLTDAVALLTMTLLCIERIVALVFPIRYYKGVKGRTENIMVISTWPLGVLFVSPYFYLHFIKELAVFSVANVTVAISSMIITTIVYKTRFQFKSSKQRTTKSKSSVIASYNVEFVIDSNMSPPILKRESTSTLVKLALENNRKNVTFDDSPQTNENYLSVESCAGCSIDETKRDNHAQEKEQKRRSSTIQSVISYLKVQRNNRSESMTGNLSPRLSIQRRATRTFLYMLIVFVAAYLPTCVMMIYMNLCMTCDCVVIHIMRDLSIMAILSSSIFRPTSFIFSVIHLRTSVYDLVCFKKRRTLR